VLESAFDELASFRIYHRDLLEPRMKVASYNQHARLLFAESWSVSAAKFTRPGTMKSRNRQVRLRTAGGVMLKTQTSQNAFAGHFELSKCLLLSLPIQQPTNKPHRGFPYSPSQAMASTWMLSFTSQRGRVSTERWSYCMGSRDMK